MFCAISYKWMDNILPNLPRRHYDEYLLSLHEFAPECEIIEIFSDSISNGRICAFCFPFVDIDINTFNHSKFEDFTESVERAMIEKYEDLDEESFCC